MTASVNPRSRLAECTSAQKSVPCICNHSKTTFTVVPERLDRKLLVQLLTTLHPHQPRPQMQKASCQSPNPIQYP